jgi:hypothetical protein
MQDAAAKSCQELILLVVKLNDVLPKSPQLCAKLEVVAIVHWGQEVEVKRQAQLDHGGVVGGRRDAQSVSLAGWC